MVASGDVLVSLSLVMVSVRLRQSSLRVPSDANADPAGDYPHISSYPLHRRLQSRPIYPRDDICPYAARKAQRI